MERFEDKLQRVLGERIELVDYDMAWPATFEHESARFSALMPSDSIRAVEHVGSTAVPGLRAKPIVDILVLVDDLHVIDSAVPRLEAAGYDFFWRPAFGDEGPRYPWLIARDGAGHRVAHIHLAIVDDESQLERVLFRDRLRAHPEVAQAYSALKRDLAVRFPEDREAYTLAKTSFIVSETALARMESRA